MNYSAVDKAYETIHQMISNGTFSPGQQIVESTIAELLGMSRTPIREATRRLQQDGLVEIIPNKGCFLKKISYEELADGYELISVLSATACRRLAIQPSLINDGDKDILKNMAEAMQKCLEQKQIHKWVYYDISFHHSLIKMSNVWHLNNLYNSLSLCINQILWFITPFFVDCELSTKEHNTMLCMIEQCHVDEAFNIARNHHLRTADIIKQLAKGRDRLSYSHLENM